MIFPGEQVEGEFRPISIGEALDPVMRRVVRYRETANQLKGLCESPIEEALGVAILDWFGWRGRYIQVCRDLKEADRPLVLIPQYRWSFYRSDFALFGCSLPSPFLIECDGKDFHSSEKQREHDLRKDLAAADLDLKTYRFSGKQIYKDAIACAAEIGWHAGFSPHPTIDCSGRAGPDETPAAYRSPFFYSTAEEYRFIKRNYDDTVLVEWLRRHPEIDFLTLWAWWEDEVN